MYWKINPTPYKLQWLSTTGSRFEQAVMASFDMEMASFGLSLAGRHGEKQGGIDLMGCFPGYPHQGANLAIQCKKREGGLPQKAIQDDVLAAAEMFGPGVGRPSIDILYFVTDSRRSLKLQNVVAQISAENMARGSFRIVVKFGDDFEAALLRHPHVHADYYPWLYHQPREFYLRQRFISAIELGSFYWWLNDDLFVACGRNNPCWQLALQSLHQRVMWLVNAAHGVFDQGPPSTLMHMESLLRRHTSLGLPREVLNAEHNLASAVRSQIEFLVPYIGLETQSFFTLARNIALLSNNGDHNYRAEARQWFLEQFEGACRQRSETLYKAFEDADIEAHDQGFEGSRWSQTCLERWRDYVRIDPIHGPAPHEMPGMIGNLHVQQVSYCNMVGW